MVAAHLDPGGPLMGARAVIDIGSNSILLTVIDPEGAVLHDEARVVGLGRGLGERGGFSKDRIDAALEVLTDYCAIAKQHGVEAWSIKAVATSASRRAMNAETVFARVLRKLGLRVRIITGDEEATLAWVGAQRDLELPDGPRLVVDLGGGSTELVLGEDDVAQRLSLEIGSVRLTERFLRERADGTYDASGLTDLQKLVESEVARFPFDAASAPTVVGVAGTVTTLAAARLGLKAYDSAAVHGSAITRDDLHHFTDVLLAADGPARRAFATTAPERGDYLLAGVVILQRVLAVARRPQLVVSDRGLRFGVLQ